jgi:hypothetical protein
MKWNKTFHLEVNKIPSVEEANNYETGIKKPALLI